MVSSFKFKVMDGDTFKIVWSTPGRIVKTTPVLELVTKLWLVFVPPLDLQSGWTHELQLEFILEIEGEKVTESTWLGS